MLWQLIADTKTPLEAETVFSEIFTDMEVSTLAKRLGVAYWLSKNRSYDNIKTNLKVSSATVADIQPKIKRAGWKLALRKMTADEWATVWENKIKHVLHKFRRPKTN